jgi:hypothetical protein
MSMFEKKLAPFREAQERKERKPMSKQHRTQMIKSLKEAMEKTKDPEMLIKLSEQAEKLMPKPGKETRGRKPNDATTPSNKKSSILHRVTGSAVDALSDGEKVTHHLVVEFEKRQREHGRELAETERNALWEELKEGLSVEERAALETLNTDEVA